MLAVYILGLTAFALALILTPLLRDLFVRADIIDRPDGSRKLHKLAVPRVGGIAILASYAGALAFIHFFAPPGARIYVQHSGLLRALLPAAGLVFLTGLLDDLISLRPWQKLLGQSAAAVLAVSMGARLSMGHGPAWLSILLSLVWLIFYTNAVNLIDGMDGLATGVGLVATLTTFAIALVTHNSGLAMATAPLAGALFGFLRYNWNPASIFLGDCGSLTIGFILGCFALIWSHQTGTLVGMSAPLMALALPLIDVGLAISRRFLRRKPITAADRFHIHHMLLAMGIPTRRAALILYGFGAIGGLLGIAVSLVEHHLGRLLILLFCCLAIFAISRLGYIEFSAFFRAISHRRVRHAVLDEIYLQELDRKLDEVATPEACWELLRSVCKDLHFATVRLDLDEMTFQEELVPLNHPPSWRTEISLGGRGRLALTRISETIHPALVTPVLHRLHTAAFRKLPQPQAAASLVNTAA